VQEPIARKLCSVLEAHAPDGASHEDVVRLFWSALVQHFPALQRHEPEGVGSVDLECGTSVRWAGRLAAGSLAIEAIDLPRCDRWEAFILCLPTGLRTGWRRVGMCVDPPGVWEDGAIHLALGCAVQPVREPTFAALAVAIAGCGPGLRVESGDLEERYALEAHLAHYKAQVTRQAGALRELRAMLPHAGAQRPAPAPPDVFPEQASQRPARSLQDLQGWADENADRIVILPRAIAHARKSPYADPDLVYEGLELLAHTYRLVKLSKLPRDELKAQADRLGLSLGGSIEPSRAGGPAEAEYFVAYEGRRRFLEHHIGRGVARDEALTMRIYFFWCERTARVVVGHLPGHLSLWRG